MRTQAFHYSFEFMALLADLVWDGVDHAAAAAKRRTRSTRTGKGRTLRPGFDTPLWNTIVENVRRHLVKRGDQVLLARQIGVPRQRVHDYFITATAMPDAEHLLQILVWLAEREHPGFIAAGARRRSGAAEADDNLSRNT